MNRDLIFGPVLVQVLLTLATYVLLIKAKIRAMKAGEVDMARRALHDDAWPESVMKINNNIRNQFEVPVLFYVLIILLLDTGHASSGFVTAAWAFVGLRTLHSAIHCTYNDVMHRFTVYALSSLLLWGMWAAFAVKLLS